MASVLSFRFSVTPISLARCEATVSFDPPPNLKGKLCYIECSAFAFKAATSPAVAYTTRDVTILDCSLPQVFSQTVGTPRNSPVAFLMNNMFSSAGPVLCNIPENISDITFTLTRGDGNDVVGVGGTHWCLVCLKAIPANSRQPPIGV